MTTDATSMSMIKWHDSTSNHARLRLAEKVTRIAALTGRNITCRDPATGALHHFSQEGELIIQEDLPDGAPASLDLPSPGQSCMVSIDLMYRDASNFKAHGNQHFQGVLKEQDLDILLTSLWMEWEGIIPHQLGLKDLQVEQDWEMDFEHNDHPWHTVEDLEIKDPVGRPQDLGHLLVIARDRVAQGWDEIAAIMTLQND